MVSADSQVSLDLNDLNNGLLRQAPDGWHAILNLRGVEHRVWFKEAPVIAVTYAVELPSTATSSSVRMREGAYGEPLIVVH